MPPKKKNRSGRTGAREQGPTSISSQAAPAAPSLSMQPLTPLPSSANANEETGLSQSHSLLQSKNVFIAGGEFSELHGHQANVVIHINQGSSGSPSGPSSGPPPSNETDHINPNPSSGQSTQTNYEMEIPLQRSNDIYERHLSPKGRGFPLWIPGPNQVLHINYKRTGIRIGDVGIITHSGGFSFLFNICLPHNDPVNPRVLPEHFAPISPPIEATDVDEFMAFEDGSHLASASIKRLQTDIDISFESTASEGAILTMPRGARSEDLGNFARFREYAAANVADWYKFVNGHRGREAKNGDVRLVVGYDKTTSWGMATFANQTNQNNCRLTFRPLGGAGLTTSPNTYAWEYSGVAEVRAGPSSNQNDRLRMDSDPPDVQFENQCLFIRTLNITLADDVWTDIHSSLGSVHVDSQSNQMYPPVKNYSSNHPHSNNTGTGSSSNSLSSQGLQSGTQRTASHLYGDVRLVDNPTIFISGPLGRIMDHPSKALNDILLAKIPTAKMVITHDNDWSSFITQYETFPDMHEVAMNILSSQNICEENGVVFLQPEVLADSDSVNPGQEDSDIVMADSVDTETPFDKSMQLTGHSNPLLTSSHLPSMVNPSSDFTRAGDFYAGTSTATDFNTIQSSFSPQWGRVLICGGTDWTNLGRKYSGGPQKWELSDPQNPDLLEPHLLRSLLNVKIVSIHTSCSGCHFVALDIEGNAWLFGRNGSAALGVPNVEYISENAPRMVSPFEIGAPKGTRFVAAACGRNHTLLVGSDGSLWTAGANSLGQCGHPTCPEISNFQSVSVSHDGKKEHVVKASAGITFSVVLTESGKVFSFGSGEKGQLGHGRTGERITTGNKTSYDIEYYPVYLKELDGKKIVDIASGQQHSLALDSAGFVYVWGYNGYCRLGLGNQVDILKPKVVPQFAYETTMGAGIGAGPTNSVVIDKQGMYWMAGKWKYTGEGSSGSPYSTFRLMQDVMGCKVSIARSGGVTHWLVTSDDDGSPMTVCWGQNAANGELGLGFDEPKSATKPTRNIPLVGLEIVDIAAGQNTTLLLAKPNEKFAEMPRHPEEVGAPSHCVKCSRDNGEDDPPLECEKCDNPWHLKCLNPPLDAVPDGEWFCPDCEEDPGVAVGAWATAKKGKAKASSKRPASSSSDQEADVKGKAPLRIRPRGVPPAKKKKQ